MIVGLTVTYSSVTVMLLRSFFLPVRKTAREDLSDV